MLCDDIILSVYYKVFMVKYTKDCEVFWNASKPQCIFCESNTCAPGGYWVWVKKRSNYDAVTSTNVFFPHHSLLYEEAIGYGQNFNESTLVSLDKLLNKETNGKWNEMC